MLENAGKDAGLAAADSINAAFKAAEDKFLAAATPLMDLLSGKSKITITIEVEPK